MNEPINPIRNTVFISKATPGDDEFVLWLAPKLEAAGYKVFADILCLDAGDGWRLKITRALQEDSVKMLLCCSDETLSRNGVLEEIEIAKDLTNSLNDPNFILPLKLRKYKKLFGIGGLQYTDFENSWAEGLVNILESLEKQNVPKNNIAPIQPEWSAYQRKLSNKLLNEPETLTSNWLRVISAPDTIHFIKAKGILGEKKQSEISASFPLPLVPFEDGFISFASGLDFENHDPNSLTYNINKSIEYNIFADQGWEKLGIEHKDGTRILINLYRQAWEKHCAFQKFFSHRFNNEVAHIVNENKIDLSKRVKWGRQGQKRNSMLRNIAKKKVWEYGVSARPSFFPFPHFRLKGRVLFSDMENNKKTNIIEDNKIQHRLRRSVCSAWRNKAWHGRLMAFMELLAGESPYVSLPVGNDSDILVDAMPIQLKSPVRTKQRNLLGEDAEEKDLTTLNGYFSEEES